MIAWSQQLARSQLKKKSLRAGDKETGKERILPVVLKASFLSSCVKPTVKGGLGEVKRGGDNFSSNRDNVGIIAALIEQREFNNKRY